LNVETVSLNRSAEVCHISEVRAIERSSRVVAVSIDRDRPSRSEVSSRNCIRFTGRSTDIGGLQSTLVYYYLQIHTWWSVWTLKQCYTSIVHLQWCPDT